MANRAFQQNAFQRNAFQIGEDGPSEPPLPAPPGTAFGTGAFYTRKKIKQLVAAARGEIEDEEAGEITQIYLKLLDD